MKTTFGIKNFRVFDENGVDIELAPITILTGKNSAGKSSIVKAIAVLNSFLEQIRRDKVNNNPIEFSKYKLEFNKILEGSLGNFGFVRHRGSNHSTITFEYTTHSTMLFKDVKVSFTFKDEDEGKDEKYMHNGVLSGFCVMTTDGDVIYSSSKNKFHINLTLIKESFCSFVKGEFFANVFLGNIYKSGASREEKKELILWAKQEYDKVDEDIRKNINRYLRDPFSYHEPIVQKGSYEDLDSINNGGQIFSFPVIDNFLGCMNKTDVITHVNNILKDEDKIDDNEKYVIKKFLSDILGTGKSISEYWKERESDFLGSVKDNDNPLFKMSNFDVVFPRPYMLNVGQNNKLTFRYYQKKGDDDIKKEEALNRWADSLLLDFVEARYELLLLDNAYKRLMQRKDSSYIQDEYKEYNENDENYGLFEHPSYRMLCEYASRAIENLLFPTWSENLFYISSSRALPRRLYTPNADNDFYQVLNNYLIALSEYETYQNHYRSQNKNNYIPNTFLNHWIGQEGFSLGKTISVESIMGSAIVVKLIKDNGAETFLTDEGHGLTQLISILLSVETTILKARGVKYNNYVDQSMLDGLNTLKFYYEQQTIAVEEPEIHLHPAFQSKLTDMFVDASEYNIHFVVETHSEYLIRKIQKLVAIQTLENNGILKSTEGIDKSIVSINYLYDADPSKRPDITIPQLQRIELEDDGTPKTPFGSGFFDEADNLSMELFTLKMTIK